MGKLVNSQGKATAAATPYKATARKHAAMLAQAEMTEQDFAAIVRVFRRLLEWDDETNERTPGKEETHGPQ